MDKCRRGAEGVKGNEKARLCCVPLFPTPWTVAHQAPLTVAFSRQECWSGLPFPSPGHLPDPGIKSGSPASADRFLGSPSSWQPPLYFVFL